MNYIDLIIIIYVAFNCFQGYRRGFIKTLFDTLGVVISFFLSKQYSYVTENFLMGKTKIFDKIHGFVESEVSRNIFDSFDEMLRIPPELQNILSKIIETEGIYQTDTFTVFADNISIIIVRSISFVITFLVIYAILVAISSIIDVLFKLPLLNVTNKVFGAGTGLIKSVIVLYIVFALCSPLVGFIPESVFSKSVLSSESSKIFYDNNIILNYLSYKGFYDN